MSKYSFSELKKYEGIVRKTEKLSETLVYLVLNSIFSDGI